LESLPEDIVLFVRKYVERLGTLELLLFLHSSRRTWTIPQLSSEMRSSTTAVEIGLAGLCAHELAAKDEDSFRFSPVSPELEQMTVRLAACYRERRAALIAAIYARSNDAVLGFAEAFRIKKGGGDG
jgi:hypothetical protein